MHIAHIYTGSPKLIIIIKIYIWINTNASRLSKTIKLAETKKLDETE